MRIKFKFQIPHSIFQTRIFPWLIATLFFCSLIISCKKDVTQEEPKVVAPVVIDTNTYGSLTISFANVVGNNSLVLNDSTYVNQQGENFSVTSYLYYISNIKLIDVDGNVYIESESYHLIDASNSGTLNFTLKNVLAKNYASIVFMIGVDSLHNVSGAQGGDLDPALGMFWTWSTGYIMAKLEGTSEVSTLPGLQIGFHIAGFSGANNVLKTVNLAFPTQANVTATAIPQVKIQSDLLEWFKSPSTISFVTTPSVLTSSANAKLISDNYQDMFTVTQVVN